MILRDNLETFCRTFLHLDTVPDPWCKNGLQVPGKSEINKIALGTTASKNFLEMAADWKADAVLVHHGLFWGNGVKKLTPELTKRLQILLQNNISLFGYHLPLDAHPEIGNNAQIAKKLGLQKIEMVDICAVGDLPQPVDFQEFMSTCEQIFAQPVNFGEPFLQKKVSRIGICSGGGSDYAEQCKAAGADTFIVGELSEHRYHDFSEMPINFLACGHHATERFGIQALGDILINEYANIEVSYFTEPCPI